MMRLSNELNMNDTMQLGNKNEEEDREPGEERAQGLEVYRDMADIAALVEKYRPAINAILEENNTEAQRQQAMKLGIDPDKMMENYADLAQKALELRKQNEIASKWNQVAGIAAGAAVFLPFIKTSNKHFIGKDTIKWLTAFCASATAYVLGSGVATALFTSKIRDEAANLSIEARDALERELAMALEKYRLQQASDEQAEQVAMRLRKEILENRTLPELITEGNTERYTEKVDPNPQITSRGSYREEAVKPSSQTAAALG